MRNVVLLGFSGWPKAHSATSHKQGAIALALVRVGFCVTVSNYVSFDAIDKSQISGRNNRIYWKFWTYRRSLLGLRVPMLFLRLVGSLCESIWLLKHRPYAIIVSDRTPLYLISRLFIARIIGSKLLITLVEDPESSFSLRFRALNLKLYELVLTKANGLLPISDSLKHYVNNLGSLNSMILGPMHDFESHKLIVGEIVRNRIVFCASAAYREQFKFCRDIYDHLHSEGYSQVWIVSGNKDDIKFVKELADNRNIDVLSGLSNNELYFIYGTSGALLMPMFDTVRDKNRYPNKIAEYLASGRPVITSRVGEIEKLIDCGLVREAHINNAKDYARQITEAISQNRMHNIDLAKDLFDLNRVAFKLKKFIEFV